MALAQLPPAPLPRPLTILRRRLAPPILPPPPTLRAVAVTNTSTGPIRLLSRHAHRLLTETPTRARPPPHPPSSPRTRPAAFLARFTAASTPPAPRVRPGARAGLPSDPRGTKTPLDASWTRPPSRKPASEPHLPGSSKHLPRPPSPRLPWSRRPTRIRLSSSPMRPPASSTALRALLPLRWPPA